MVAKIMLPMVILYYDSCYSQSILLIRYPQKIKAVGKQFVNIATVHLHVGYT